MLLVSTDSYFVRLADTDPWTIAFLVSACSLVLHLVLQRSIEGGAPVERFRAFPRGLATVGLLQYIAPSGQLLLAVLVFGEPFGTERFLAFLLIWIAVSLYSIDSFLASQAENASTA